MLPDLIITWPQHVEYPAFRQFVRDFRSRFNKIIIVFSNHNIATDYSQFAQWSMQEDKCDFLYSPPVLPGQDWRNAAVNAALKISDSDWVWFMEQDFLITRNEFWDEVEEFMQYAEVIGVTDSGRLHPCCLLIRRESLNKTCCNFGIVPDKLDHFGLIQQDIEDIGMALRVISPKTYHHMNGLSHNFYLASTMQEIVYQPEEFKRYLQACLNLSQISMDPRFVSMAKSILLQ